MNTFVITELKKLDDGSYEEIGTVGDDSKPVIWSSSSWGQYLEFYLINDFEVSQSSLQTLVKCHAVCANNITALKRITEEVADDFNFKTVEKGLGRFDFKRCEELTGERYRFQVYITSLKIDNNSEDGIHVTITPNGGEHGWTHINIQIEDELLKRFVLALQSKESNTNDFFASLRILQSHLNPYEANNREEIMIDLTSKVEIDGCGWFEFKTDVNSGQWITDLIKQEKSIATKLKRIGWRVILLAMISIVGGAAGGLLLYYLFEPYLIQLSEWLNSIGL
jgi:hypothetical protein